MLSDTTSMGNDGFHEEGRNVASLTEHFTAFATTDDT